MKKLTTGLLTTLALFSLGLVFGCSNIDKHAADDSVKITIRSSKGTTTVYKVDSETKAMRSAVHTDKIGLTDSRSYEYGSDGTIRAIYVDNPYTGRSVINYGDAVENSSRSASTADASITPDKVRTKTVTYEKGTGRSAASLEGKTETYTYEYFYDENGNAGGILVTDENGNVFSKGGE